MYFYLDDNAKLINFLLNVTSSEYGFSFTDYLNNEDYIDTVLSNTTVSGGKVMPYGINPLNFSYDTFDSSINDTLWGYPEDVNYNVPSGWGYDVDGTTTETTNSIDTYIALDAESGCPTDNFDQSRTQYLDNNISWFNLNTIDQIDFDIYFDYFGREESQTTSAYSGDCTAEFNVLLGNINLLSIDSDFYDCEYAGEDSCNERGIATKNISVNMVKQINESWKVKLSGIERHYSEGSVDTCGNYNIILNWTEGKKYSYYDSCTDTITDIDNEFYITPSYSVSQPLYISNYGIARYEEVLGSGPYTGCYGCGYLYTNFDLYVVNNTRKSYQNSTVVSSSIFDSSAEIASLEMSSSYTGTPTFFISGDNGDNWQNILMDTSTPIINTGNHIKWKADIDVGEGGYLINAPYISSANIFTEKSDLSNITFDVGNDGIIDYTIDGPFDNTNGTVVVNLSSASLDTSFTDTPVVGHTHAVPVVVSTDTSGQLNINWIDLVYNPNPVYLDYSSIQNFLTSFGNGMTIIPMILEASGLNSIVNLTALNFDYAGGNDTIEVLAHNEDYSQNVSRNITYYYSRWDYSWVPEDVDGVWFYPKSSTENNTTPYGQSSTTPILNITNYGYGGKNATLSILQDDMLSCVNTTISLDNNKSNGWLITDNWTELTNMSYLDTVDIYLWADYNCTYYTWYLFQPNFYFRQCVDGGVCDTSLI